MRAYVGYVVHSPGIMEDRRKILKISTNLESVIREIEEAAYKILCGNYSFVFQEHYISRNNGCARNHNFDENNVFVYGDDKILIWRHYEIIAYEVEED